MDSFINGLEYNSFWAGIRRAGSEKRDNTLRTYTYFKSNVNDSKIAVVHTDNIWNFCTLLVPLAQTFQNVKMYRFYEIYTNRQKSSKWIL